MRFRSNTKEHKVVDPSSKDFWDKLSALSGLIASIFIPVVALLIGNLFSQSTKDSENNLRYVELAVSIIRSAPSEQTAALREWAVDVLAKHSVAVPLSVKAQAELKAYKVALAYGFNPNTSVNFDELENTKWKDAATYYGTMNCRSCSAAASATGK